jgi:hypothetical protein
MLQKSNDITYDPHHMRASISRLQIRNMMFCYFCLVWRQTKLEKNPNYILPGNFPGLEKSRLALRSSLPVQSVKYIFPFFCDL